MTRAHALELVALAGATAAVAGCVGAVALYVVRRRGVAVQVIVVALSAVVAVGVGTRLAAQAMLVDSDDVVVLDVALVSAGAVAVLVALLLGRRVGRASAALLDAAQRVGRGEHADAASTDAPRELARLARELDETSARLREARSRERALDRSRRELVAWVSHDLRTPLAGIRAIVEALEDGVVTDAETVRRYHRTLREEADHLAGLVDDLFELSRAQAGVLQLELDRVSLGDVVSDALAGAGPVAAAKGVRLVGRLDGPAPELIASAPELLRVLRNILENAIRHTPADGTILVEAGADGERAFVTVHDSGGGIPEEHLPRVFDVAFSGDPARSSGGAGLGLAIARSLVEAHDGDITVENANGGARFTVLLPLRPVSPA
ncbi:MAG: two-component sensor histidine kinase [Acidimicrobiia bacterium]|nr:MAG: two-component sensor histidine kinase [Acidimicrobiia bacterium]